MNWKILDSVEQLNQIIASSEQQPFAIFKHSTRCNISSMAKNRIERNWELLPDNIVMYYLDLLTYRPISNAIESVLGIEHQSPQLLLIENGKCTYHASHTEISIAELIPLLKAS